MNRTFCSLALSTLLTVFIWWPATVSLASEVPSSVKTNAFRYALEITQLFPPDKNVVVSLGTSQIYLDTSLELLVSGYKDRESYFRELPFVNLLNLIYWQEEEVFRFLDRYLPSSEELNGRRLVFVRALFKSATVKWFYPLLNDYFKSRGYKTETASYFVTPGEDLRLEEVVKKVEGMNTLVIRDNPDWFSAFVIKKRERQSGAYTNSVMNHHRYRSVVIPEEPWLTFPQLNENPVGHSYVLKELLTHLEQLQQISPPWIDPQRHKEALEQLQTRLQQMCLDSLASEH